MGDDFGYKPKPPPENYPFWNAGSHANSERFFVRDEHGYVEVVESIVWEDHYVWVHSEIVDNTTIFVFEFSG